MQTIDPIKPRTSPPPPRPRESGPTKSIDGFGHPRTQKHQQSQAALATGARFTKIRSSQKKSRNRDIYIAILVSPVLLVLSALSIVGMGLVAVYGVVVIWRRQSSRVTFVLALTAFAYMFVLQMFVEAWAQTEAVLAYLLLTIGAVSLAIETRSRGLWLKKQ